MDEAINIARTHEAMTPQVKQLESQKKDINGIKRNENKHSSDKKPMQMK